MNPVTNLFAQVRSLFAAVADKQEAEVKPSEPFETETNESWFDEGTEMTEGEEKDENEEVDSDHARSDDEHDASDSSEC